MPITPIALMLVNTIAFMAIGAWVALALLRWRMFPKEFALTAAIAVSGLLGYAMFFVYLASPAAGKVATGGIYMVGLALLGYMAWRTVGHLETRRIVLHYMVPPLLLMIAALGIYSTLTFSCRYQLSPANLNRVTDSCMLENKSSDGILPLIFADKLVADEADVPAGDWHLADRTPLQIGMVVGLIGFVGSDRDGTFAYEYTGMFLQLSWIAALWGFLMYLRVKKRVMFWVLWMSVFSGFFYYNSIFIWPKLYAAGFVLTAIAMLLLERGKAKAVERPPLSYFIGAAMLTVLGYLAHPGVMFTLLGLAVVLFVRWKLWRPAGLYWRPLLIAAAAGIVLMAPWQIYKATSTHSDRLMKWHMAGAGEVDDRGTLQAIADSYRKLTLAKWVAAKLENTKTLFLPDETIPEYRQVFLSFSDLPKDDLNYIKDQPPAYFHLARARLNEFYFTFIGLGVLNVGWLVLILRQKSRHSLPSLRPLGLVTALSLGFYVLLMFSPHETIIHQGSYATMMLLFALATLAIAQASRVFAWTVGLLQFGWFAAVWVVSLYMQNGYTWVLPAVLLVGGVLVFRLVFALMNRLTMYPAETKSEQA